MHNFSFWSSGSLQNELPEVQSHPKWRLPTSLYKMFCLKSGAQNRSILLKNAWTSKMSIYTKCTGLVFCSGLDPTHLVVEIGTRMSKWLSQSTGCRTPLRIIQPFEQLRRDPSPQPVSHSSCNMYVAQDYGKLFEAVTNRPTSPQAICCSSWSFSPFNPRLGHWVPQ